MNKADRESLKIINKEFLENNPSQIVGFDEKYCLDELNYQPNT